MSKIDSYHKISLRLVWKSVQTIVSLFPRAKKGICVWYGGARAGNIGGPLVKVKRLQQYFPEKKFGHSIVYTLSNTPYLTKLAIKILKMKKVPIVLNQNGVFYGGWFDGNWQAKNKEMAVIWKNADHVFCQSDFCFRCAEDFLGARQGNTEILYNAVDLQHFRPKAYETAKKMRTFLVTGKFDDHMFYRIEASLKGFKLAKDYGLDAQIKIAGWMSEKCMAMCIQLIHTLGLGEETFLIGSYTQEQAPDIYRSADIYLMLKHNDPCPNTVLEALACGLPVLYSNSGGIPELATGKSGYPLEVRQGFDKTYVPSAQIIADGMMKILEDLPNRRIAARARAEEAFDINKWVARHHQVFEKLLAEN